jgi:hypothetical protein
MDFKALLKSRCLVSDKAGSGNRKGDLIFLLHMQATPFSDGRRNEMTAKKGLCF